MSSGQDFGANDWLVEEMYERYQIDPSSVPAEWVTYFQNNPQAAATSAPASQSSPGAGVPPTPKPVTPPNISIQTSTPAQAAPVAAAPVAPPVAAAPVAAPAPIAAAPVIPAPVQSQPVLREVAATPATPAQAVVKPAPTLATPGAATMEPLRGVAGRVVQSMEASLTVPTATSVRAVPAKLMIDNRIVINNHLTRGRGGKVSFTHLIAYAMIKSIKAMPEMNAFFGELDGKPALGRPEHINLGIAIDLAKPDGTRQLLVPSIKGCEEMDFGQFWVAYEEIVKKARTGTLTVEDYAGTTVSLTNPGTIGTVHSVPRLVQGQGLIMGVGAMDYPAEFHGASESTLARMAISKVLTLTSTYDHRVIQGAQSGDFLRRINELLLGAEGFYDEIFTALRIPYEPIRWAADFEVTKDSEIDKTARVQQLIASYRTWGHLMADIDPLVYRQRTHPDLDVQTHGLTLWDLDREFATGGFGGKPFLPLRKILGLLRDSYCRSIGTEYMHISEPEEREWFQQNLEKKFEKVDRDEQLRILRKLNSAEAFETFLQTKFVGQKRFSLEGGEAVIPLADAIISAAAERGLDEVCIGMPHRGRLNMLANIAGKSHGQIFQEFQGHYAENQVHGSGDVKYHLGTEGVFTAASGATTKIYLAANPSHLEAVNPVLEGIVRAKQDRLNTKGAYS
ncbi:MAG: multifunctional oxoglutarate decarboxylase/oxoglutarate dehydrogenase thiamine pyrophosphate-binding subunit/dihydrolipoyllysine-residue succinyltransferase subunit, partial [Actinobacteria bacterium]|nr:multifunctional oxoglutarate decarboxylase/oxoglutarate dehydrogenase thiamine pyrophosphate-binding subunit/dihydrolipoyllysine-residue succinyltransferase subunit [Actinomycetota bacterium]